MSPSLPDVLASAVPFAVPLRVPFRGVTRRVGLLIEGPAGWGEFSPFDDYLPMRAARWLEAALEAAYGAWPRPVRDWVAVNAIVPAVPAEQVAEVLGAANPASVKVKVTGDLEADEPRLAAVRAAVGRHARIRLDVNAGWTMEQALVELPILDRAAGGVEYVEQPLGSLAQIAELRRVTGIAVAVDESIRMAADPFDRALLAEVRACADVAVLKVGPLGGVWAVLRLAEELDMPVVVSGAMETSVGLAAGVAAACALPDEPLACGLGTGALLARDVVCVPVVPLDGRLAPMRVTPDPAALRAAELAVQPDEVRALFRRLRTVWAIR